MIAVEVGAEQFLAVSVAVSFGCLIAVEVAGAGRGIHRRLGTTDRSGGRVGVGLVEYQGFGGALFLECVLVAVRATTIQRQRTRSGIRFVASFDSAPRTAIIIDWISQARPGLSITWPERALNFWAPIHNVHRAYTKYKKVQYSPEANEAIFLCFDPF
jgi:hypothetical protein